jgi:hypothetical protein
VIPEKFLEVLKHEGVVAIATQGKEELHLSNTWNSYVQVSDSMKLLYPAAGMKVTEKNIEEYNRVQMTIGSREVTGFHGPGTGFLIKGTAVLLKSGSDFEKIKQKFPFARAAVEITIDSITQTL